MPWLFFAIFANGRLACARAYGAETPGEGGPFLLFSIWGFGVFARLTIQPSEVLWSASISGTLQAAVCVSNSLLSNGTLGESPQTPSTPSAFSFARMASSSHREMPPRPTCS